MHQGQYFDSPLTRKGVIHAENLSEMFKKIKADALFTSPLKRALQTARIIDEEINLKPIPRGELKEISFGILDGTTQEERLTKYRNLVEEREKDKLNYRFPKGESYRDCLKRVEPFINLLLEKFFNKTIILIGHEGINRVILKILLDLTFEEVFKTTQPNELVYLILIPDKVAFFTTDYGKNWHKGLNYKK